MVCGLCETPFAIAIMDDGGEWVFMENSADALRNKFCPFCGTMFKTFSEGQARRELISRGMDLLHKKVH